MRILLALSLAIVTANCTPRDAIRNAIAVGDRAESRVQYNFEQRDLAYKKSVELRLESCNLIETMADNIKAVCMMQGGCDFKSVVVAYEAAARCYESMQPKVLNIKQYRKELRGAFKDD